MYVFLNILLCTDVLCIEVPAFDALSGDLAFHPILTQVVGKNLKSFFNEVGQRGVKHFYHTVKQPWLLRNYLWSC